MDSALAHSKMATEHSPLLYTAYCPPPKPLSPEDIAQRRRSLGIESMLSVDGSTFGLVPDYLSISVSDVISRKSSQSFRSELSAAGVVGGDEIMAHDRWWHGLMRRMTCHTC